MTIPIATTNAIPMAIAMAKPRTKPKTETIMTTKMTMMITKTTKTGMRNTPIMVTKPMMTRISAAHLKIQHCKRSK